MLYTLFALLISHEESLLNNISDISDKLCDAAKDKAVFPHYNNKQGIICEKK